MTTKSKWFTLSWVSILSCTSNRAAAYHWGWRAGGKTLWASSQTAWERPWHHSQSFLGGSFSARSINRTAPWRGSVSAGIGTWGGVGKAGTGKKERRTWSEKEEGLQLLAELFRFIQLYHAALLSKRQLVAQKMFPTQWLPFLPVCTAGGLHKEQGGKEWVRG